MTIIWDEINDSANKNDDVNNYRINNKTTTSKYLSIRQNLYEAHQIKIVDWMEKLLFH